MRRMPAALRVLRLHRLGFVITPLMVLVTTVSTAASAAFAAEAATVANREALTSNPGSAIMVEQAMLSVPAAAGISILRGTATVARLRAGEKA